MTDDLPAASGDVGRSAPAVTVDDLRRFAERFKSLGDPDVMSRAWS